MTPTLSRSICACALLVGWMGSAHAEPPAAETPNAPIPAPPGTPGGAPPTDAPAGAPPPMDSGTITLQLHDPKSNLDGPPVVTLAGLAAGPLRPVDDGTQGDPHAGDHVYTATIPGWDGSTTSIEVTDGSHAWTASGAHEGGSSFWVRIHDARTLQIGEHKPDADPSSGPTEEALGEASSSASAPSSTWTATLVLWGIAAGGMAFGLGFGLMRTVRPDAPPEARVLGTVPRSPYLEPRTIYAGDVAATLSALGARRLLMIGPPPARLPPSTIGVPIEDGALPDEIYATAYDLALQEGPPIAFLVTDPSAMEGPNPVERLAARIDGRFWLILQASGAQGAGTA